MGAVALAGVAVAAPSSEAARTRVITVPCSSSTLSSAIVTANGLGTATLRLTPNCQYGITTPATAATALPAITGNVTILGGPNTTIRRASTALTLFRIFDVGPVATLRLVGISLENGSSGDGGGIVDSGTLVLDRVTLSGNTAAGLGGAIRVGPGAVATVVRTLIKANSAGLAGSAIDNAGTATVIDSRLTANNGANGGGVTTEGTGTTHFVRSTIDHDFGAALGGGIQNFGTTTLDRTVVERNRAGGNGGGILVQGGTVTATRSVVRLNTPNNCSPANSVAGCVG